MQGCTFAQAYHFAKGSDLRVVKEYFSPGNNSWSKCFSLFYFGGFRNGFTGVLECVISGFGMGARIKSLFGAGFFVKETIQEKSGRYYP